MIEEKKYLFPLLSSVCLKNPEAESKMLAEIDELVDVQEDGSIILEIENLKNFAYVDMVFFSIS